MMSLETSSLEIPTIAGASPRAVTVTEGVVIAWGIIGARAAYTVHTFLTSAVR